MYFWIFLLRIQEEERKREKYITMQSFVFQEIKSDTKIEVFKWRIEKQVAKC